MNITQKDAMRSVISSLENLKGDVEPISEELREEFDALTEKAQESEKGQALESQASDLEESLDEFDALIEKLRSATNQ